MSVSACICSLPSSAIVICSERLKETVEVNGLFLYRAYDFCKRAEMSVKCSLLCKNCVTISFCCLSLSMALVKLQVLGLGDQEVDAVA